MERDTALASLRAAGYRRTAQRIAIIDALVGDTSHPSVDELAQRLVASTGMALSTVYKVLHELVEVGEVRQLDEGAILRFDPDTSPHAHLRCTSCGRVADVMVGDLAHRLEQAARAAGHEVDYAVLSAVGVCSACSTSGARPGN